MIFFGRKFVPLIKNKFVRITIKIAAMPSIIRRIPTFIFVIFFLFTKNSIAQNSYIKQANDTIIAIIGEEIFSKHVRIDSSLTTFFRFDNRHDYLSNYNSQIDYRRASIEYEIVENNKVIESIRIEFDDRGISIYGGLEALKIYFDNLFYVRYQELEDAFKTIHPDETFSFSVGICEIGCDSFGRCDPCNLLERPGDIIWETRYYSKPLSYNEYGEFYYIDYTIYISPLDPYDFVMKSSYSQTVVD